MMIYPYQRYRTLAIRERNKAIAGAVHGVRRWLVGENRQSDGHCDDRTVADKARFVL